MYPDKDFGCSNSSNFKHLGVGGRWIEEEDLISHDCTLTHGFYGVGVPLGKQPRSINWSSGEDDEHLAQTSEN